MIRRHYFIIALGGIFLLLSGIIYSIHYLVFGDVHHIFIYLVGDLAFLPLEVLIVVVVLERILTHRETQSKMQKLNMVIGAFFSEVGNHLLQDLFKQFSNKEEISQHLNVAQDWTKKDFREAADFAHHLPIVVDSRSLDLNRLKEFLSAKREFILMLLENPTLLENDRFTDLLWATTHLDEELAARSSLSNTPDKDLDHIAGDVRRMYDHLASEWLDHAEHLKSDYPYLFSLVLRTHPFQEHPSPVIR
jgi:hypothetical protein